mgnify:CR=1 FL=1
MSASGVPLGPITRRGMIAPWMRGMQRACAVRLIDRRTGAAHRVNGTPLVIITCHPQEAAAELLEGRDPAHWEARIDPIEPAPQR